MDPLGILEIPWPGNDHVKKLSSVPNFSEKSSRMVTQPMKCGIEGLGPFDSHVTKIVMDVHFVSMFLSILLASSQC